MKDSSKYVIIDNSENSSFQNQANLTNNTQHTKDNYKLTQFGCDNTKIQINTKTKNKENKKQKNTNKE